MHFSLGFARVWIAAAAVGAVLSVPAFGQASRCDADWRAALSITTRAAYERYIRENSHCPEARVTQLLIEEEAYFPEGQAPDPNDEDVIAAANVRAAGFANRYYDGRRRSISDAEYHREIFKELRYVFRGASSFTLSTAAQELMRWAGRGVYTAQDTADPRTELAHVTRRVEIGRFLVDRLTLTEEERYAVDRDYTRYLEATGRLTEARDQILSLLDRSQSRPPLERARLQLRLRHMYDVLGDTVSADRNAAAAMATYRAAPEAAFSGDGVEIKYRIHEAALEAAVRGNDEPEILRITEVLEGTFHHTLESGMETLRILAQGQSAVAARRGIEISIRAASLIDPSGNAGSIGQVACGMGMINAAHRIQDLSRDQVLAQLRFCGSNEQYRTWRVRAQAGAAYESLGELEEAERWYQSAIERAEEGRETIPVAERVAYFGGAIKTVYDGLIRVNARRHAAQSGDARSLAALIDATQRIRARQFEDLAEREEPRFDVAALRALQARLSEGDIVIGAVSLADQTIVWYIGPRSQGVVSRPIGQHAMEERVRHLLSVVSTSSSPIESVERELVSFSAGLLGAVQPELASARRAIFLLDGSLALAPPAILSTSVDRYEPLMQTMLVQSAPTVNAMLLAPAPTEWRTQLLAMADPIYPSLSEASAAASGEIGRARVARGGGLVLPPLPETREEVQLVAEALGGTGETLYGADASEARLRRTDLRGVRFVHLATHGLLGGELAGLREPALLLSAGADDDGVLRMSEAQQLRMNAELTVLSACNTGSGVVFDGEGVMGLSRAFLLAGSRGVLVSMWPVDSEATVDYMSKLYGHIGAGTDTAEANVRAMREMRAQYRHPFYWAPFSLISNSGPARAQTARPQVAASIPDARRLAAATRAPVASRDASPPDFGVFRDCEDVCPEMIALPGGSFLMGAPPEERSAGNEERPQRAVRVEPLAVGRFEITRGEYFAFANATDRLRYPSHTCYQNTETGYREWLVEEGLTAAWLPMSCVSWNDAQAYVEWLSQRTGQSYRLLTEAEWEYAARGGTTTPFWWGTDDDPEVQAQRYRRYDVRAGRANGFGLLGISSHGEWVEDCFVWGYANGRSDAAAVATPRTCNRVVRDRYAPRITSRYGEPPEIPTEFDPFDSEGFGRYQYIGFRVARVLTQR